jgi:RimJ/RimL family protein N-acetyltransferase
MFEARTNKLILRRWRASDRLPFAQLNADSRVMKFFPRPLSAQESDLLVDQIESDFEQHGFGLCAAELVENHAFIGFIGLAVPSFSAHFTPCVEIGWRLSAEYWGRGLATEGAREIVRQAFDVHGLQELVSFTVPANVQSRRVMEKLGMTHHPDDDFNHPRLPEGDPLRRHVLYRLRRQSRPGA